MPSSTNVSLTTKESNIFILFALLNLLDFITTKAIVDYIGFVGELNPIMYSLITYTNTIWSIFFIKLSVVSIIFLCFLHLEYEGIVNKYNVYNALYILCILFSGICVWNTYCMFSYGLI